MATRFQRTAPTATVWVVAGALDVVLAFWAMAVVAAKARLRKTKVCDIVMAFLQVICRSNARHHCLGLTIKRREE